MFDPDNDDAHAPSKDPPMIVGKALQCLNHVTALYLYYVLNWNYL